MKHALTLIVVLPLVGFLLNGFLATRFGGNRVGRTFVTATACGLPIAAFLLTLACLFRLQAAGYEPLVETAYTWALIGGKSFEIAFYFDRLTAVMTLIVTGVGSLIHIYSAGYMKDDESYARYFAYLNLFLFFMLLLVLGRSLLVLFVGWEGVGLASYLLIGFWFEDPEKAAAGKKAFIVNRIGDAGFLLGMFLLWQTVGTLDMDRINAAFGAATLPAVSASLVGVLLFIGATGKSAQIPLYVWLPDAMAGPTPVSALIHAATMVTAGVYLVARLSGIYVHAPAASALVAGIGAATALLAATIALVQTDIKKVLAYSTVSQLGLMFVALGVGAYGVAVFHVTTHAFFKACLFLGAGSVIHALSGEQDILKMGGLARKIPVTFATFAIATAAIAGIPPLAGFFSKDEILWFSFASAQGGSTFLWLVASLTSLLTSFYMFRLLWLTFFGASQDDPRGRAPRPRVAAVDDRRARRPRRGVGGRRLLRPAPLPRADAAAAERGARAPPLREDADRRRRGGRLRRPRGRGVPLRRRGEARRAAARALSAGARAALRQVLRRRGLRLPAQPAAALAVRPGLPAPRRPRAAGRDAERPRRLGAAHRRLAVAHPDRQPPALRVPGAGRHRRRTGMDVGPCLTPRC